MTTAAEILNKAAVHLQDRASTYDKPSGERSMGATVAAFSAITGITLTAEQGWLFMAVLKAVRSQQGAFKADNYEDGAAYFALACETAEIDRAELTTEDICRAFMIPPHMMGETGPVKPMPSKPYPYLAEVGAQMTAKAALEKVERGDDGWIEWGGGKCPVDGEVVVDARFRYGGEVSWCVAKNLIWMKGDRPSDITHYRLAKEQA